jgi:hypothetical protein
LKITGGWVGECPTLGNSPWCPIRTLPTWKKKEKEREKKTILTEEVSDNDDSRYILSLLLTPARTPSEDLAARPPSPHHPHPPPPERLPPKPHASPAPITYYPKELPRQPIPVIFQICQQSRIDVGILYRPLKSTVFRTAPGEVVSLDLDTVTCDDMFLGNRRPPESSQSARFFAEHSVLSRLALDRDFAATVTYLTLPAQGLKVLQNRGAEDLCNCRSAEMCAVLL